MAPRPGIRPSTLVSPRIPPRRGAQKGAHVVKIPRSDFVDVGAIGVIAQLHNQRVRLLKDRKVDLPVRPHCIGVLNDIHARLVDSQHDGITVFFIEANHVGGVTQHTAQQLEPTRMRTETHGYQLIVAAHLSWPPR